jgi:hypothetical protein
VDHHAQPPQLQPEPSGVLGVDDLVDGLHLEKMISRPEGAEGRAAAVVGSLGHLSRLGLLEGAGVLDSLEVVLGPEPARDRPASAVAHDFFELGRGKVEAAAAAGTRRYRARELVQERRKALAALVYVDVADQKANPAPDVVADAARGDHALGDVERRDSADRKAVAPVDVRHRVGRAHDAREAGNVPDLLERVLELTRLDHAPARKDPARHPHRRPLLELPFKRRDLAHVSARPAAEP